MELYLDLVSPPCRFVYLFAKKLNIPFEFKLIELVSGQQFSEEFGKVSIVRMIPVMKDGNFILTESAAIVEYLAQKHSAPDHWCPAELQQRARLTEYLNWQPMNIALHCARVFLLRALYPMVMDTEVPKEKMDEVLADAKQSLTLLQDKFLQDKPFIIGDKISAADLVAVLWIMQPFGTGVDLFEGFPKLQAWRDRVRKEIGEKLFDESHDIVRTPSNLAPKLKAHKRLDMVKARMKKMFG
ncbi:glutathione S-transferase theta-3-like isoform X1 [Acanthochromis polyacanthus]|uniref:glutathione S-transferase theta-3-like isoform X1 n=1 Tax=Acanthochromis polyacanthus TaxID=80966 RepID=UPI002234A358|nr:glutathione S-transferase theta-3-like isoform X1 [Acanthochromis polyacanthus]